MPTHATMWAGSTGGSEKLARLEAFTWPSERAQHRSGAPRGRSRGISLGVLGRLPRASIAAVQGDSLSAHPASASEYGSVAASPTSLDEGCKGEHSRRHRSARPALAPAAASSGKNHGEWAGWSPDPVCHFHPRIRLTTFSRCVDVTPASCPLMLLPSCSEP